MLNECKLDFTKQKFNLANYDKLHETLKAHLGTAMYIKRGMRWSQIDLIPGRTADDRKMEGVVIKLTTDFESGTSTIVRGIYVPVEGQGDLRREIEELLTAGDAINVGDMNLLMTQLNHSRNRGAGIEVQHLINDGMCSLAHTNLPSRPCHAGNGILDLAILTGDLQHTTYPRAKQLDSISSDHIPWLLTVDLEIEEEQSETRNMQPLFTDEQTRKRYIQLIENNLDPSRRIDTHSQCEDYVKHLEDTITTALDEVAPKRVVDRKELLPTDIQMLIAERNEVKRNIKRTRGHIAARQHFNEKKRELQVKLMEHREATWCKRIECTNDKRAKMWRVQRALKKPPQRLPHLDGCTTEKETIDQLVDTAIVKESRIFELDEGSETYTPYLALKKTTFDEVKKAIYRCKNRKAPGPDQIKADALKLAGPAFFNALARVINNTLETGYYPSRWKLGDCIFLHKAGKNYRDAKSYRPITLLNIMGKVCEHVMHQRILDACQHIIPDFQHGFIKQRGTGTQILRTGKYISDALAKKHSVDKIPTNLSKAFDSINHKGLVKKLYDKHIPSNIIKLTENYLANRRARGKFRTITGDEVVVPHGVPQGSILGPLIFNLYVFDIPKTRIAGQMLSQYADDLCILNAADTPDNATRRAEWAAEEITDYYERNGLQCNVDKTECIMFSTKNPRSERNRRGYRPTVRLKGTDLEYKKCVRYLGVQMDKRLSMNEHVKCTLRKAKQIRGMLAPVIGYYSKVNVETKYVIIQACLLPVLDYGIVQLLPRISRTNLLAIERQYRMALKAAGGFPRSIPTEMLWNITDDDPWHIRVKYICRRPIVNLGISYCA